MLGNHAWKPATITCYETLETTTLDLWLIPLNQQVQLDVLAEDERLRMNRYRFAVDQRKFAVARGSLRQILAGYSQQRPAGLVFNYGPHGKPCLRDHRSLQFNLSHSGDYALCGVAKHVVGVDIEQLRVMDRLDGLIRRCLAPSEQRAIAQVLPTDQSTAFLRYWTCKEAYLKATGQGISESLKAIEVDLTASPTLRVAGQSWQLRMLVPCSGYTAAAVTSPEVTHMRFWVYGA